LLVTLFVYLIGAESAVLEEDQLVFLIHPHLLDSHIRLYAFTLDKGQPRLFLDRLEDFLDKLGIIHD
jgi:hypothetical protein